MRLFDSYLFVDWSAAVQPRQGRDSIWVAVSRGADAAPLLENPSTRAQARALIRRLLVARHEHRQRVLVGFDFAFGYPAGFSRALRLARPGSSWLAVARRLRAATRDDLDNRNNRFEVAEELNRRCGRPPGPFWGCPARRGSPNLRPTRPAFPFETPGARLPEHRLVERRVRERGESTIQSVWKLYTTGAVGSQTLTGLPVVLALREDPALEASSRVWPFETGFTSQPTPETGPFVVFAEVWPRLAPAGTAEVRDAAQVEGLVAHFEGLDQAGRLGCLFDTPPGLAPAAIHACVDEEGWILGA